MSGDLTAAVAAARAGQRAEATFQWGDRRVELEGTLTEDCHGCLALCHYVVSADNDALIAFRVLPDVAPDPEPHHWLVPKVPDDPDWWGWMPSADQDGTPENLRIIAAHHLARADAIDAAARAQAHSSDITAEELALEAFGYWYYATFNMVPPVTTTRDFHRALRALAAVPAPTEEKDR